MSDLLWRVRRPQRPAYRQCPCDTLAAVRLSHFWTLMAEEFGPTYAASLSRDHALDALAGRTAAEALEAGVPPREVWLALCDDLDVPPERRHGRDRPPRKTD